MPTATSSSTPPYKPANRNRILPVVLIYAMFGAGWIVLSDKLAQLIFSDPHQIILVSIVKGWLFVGITSLLLYSLMQYWGGGVTATKIMPVGSRRLRTSFLALAVIIIALTATVIIHAFKHQREIVLGRMHTVTEFKARQITDWIKARQDDADFVQAGDFFSEQYRRWQQAGDRHSGERLQLQLQQLQQSRGFDAVMLLSPEFKTLWASGSLPLTVARPLQTVAQLAAAERKLQRAGPYLDAVGTPCLDFMIPLTAVPGSPPVVVLHLDLMNRLSSILHSRPPADTNDRTLLFQRDGDRLILLNALKQPKAATARPEPAADAEHLFTAQLLRAEASPGLPVEGLDERNVAVIGVAQAIPGTDWLLVSQQDLSEFYAEIVDDVMWGGFVGLLALFIAGAGFYLFQQRQQLLQAQAVQQSQTERLRALDLLAAIADSSDGPIFAKDRDGCYILFNHAACLLVGKSAEDILGRNDQAIFSPERAEMLMTTGQRVLDRNRTITQEEVLDTLQGQRAFLTTQGPLRDSEGKIIGIFGISRDITERKQAELALRDSESRFRALVEQSLAGIYIIQDDRFRYVNPGFTALFGYDSAEALIDKVPVTELVSLEDRERVAENMRRRIDAEVAYLHYSFTGLRRDGSRIEVEAHGRSFDYRGRPAIIGFILNITERKTVEAQLRISEERLKLALDAAGDGLWDWDLRSGLAYLTPQYYAITGYRPEQVTPDFEFFKSTVHPDDLPQVLEIMAAHLQGKIPTSEFDYRLVTATEEIKWMRGRGRVVEYDAAGFPLRVIGTITDISERKAAEEALLRQTQELAQRNSELERFNRASVGRELDMIALKRQVNELSRQLGQEPPYALAFLDADDDPKANGAVAEK